MPQINNKIEANDRSILEVLDNKKYTVDYFQREYSWERKHIEQLVTDLASSFLNDFDPDHERSEVENYNSYYLGPYVLSEKDGKRSIIDGQQRLTSLTLLMIFLHNLQKELGHKCRIESLIFSEKYDQKSFNITVEERAECLESLFYTGSYDAKDSDDASTANMAERYNDIAEAFPKEIDQNAFPYFVDWLKERVVMVEIVAYSDENAYTIFETMNDRGLNLTASEMLKGFLLSKLRDSETRLEANALWKKAMQSLHTINKEEDLRFFQAWFRAKYAVSIRQSKAGSTNEDFEKIGTRFHAWFRENLELIPLNPERPDEFNQFIYKDFQFFLECYLRIRNAEQHFSKEMEHVYYAARWGIAESLRYPLLLAPLVPGDDPATIAAKFNRVAKFIEQFAVRRSINFRKFGASSIRYTMSTLTKDIRGKNLTTLEQTLGKTESEQSESWNGMVNLRWHGQNRSFIKFLLSRISGYIDEQAGTGSNFVNYYENPNGKPFEIEHIWANKFAEHRDEFEQEHEFHEWRNRIGDLILLPNGSNQSYKDKPYTEKQPHYLKENLLAKSLCEMAYQNNPNFTKLKANLNLPFKAHSRFKKQDITERGELYQKICEHIWSNHNDLKI